MPGSLRVRPARKARSGCHTTNGSCSWEYVLERFADAFDHIDSFFYLARRVYPKRIYQHIKEWRDVFSAALTEVAEAVKAHSHLPEEDWPPGLVEAVRSRLGELAGDSFFHILAREWCADTRHLQPPTLEPWKILASRVAVLDQARFVVKK